MVVQPSRTSRVLVVVVQAEHEPSGARPCPGRRGTGGVQLAAPGGRRVQLQAEGGPGGGRGHHAGRGLVRPRGEAVQHLAQQDDRARTKINQAANKTWE